jgi:hypothetical protein
MRRSVVVLVLLAACGTRQTAETSMTPTSTVRVAGAGASTSGRGMAIGTATQARIDTVWVALDRVWKVMPAVFGILEIPISELDAESNVMGNAGMKVFKKLGEVPLTRYLDCGRTQIEQNAETYEVHLEVMTKLTKGPEGTTLIGTTVEAQAKPTKFAGEYVRCRSKGTLEARVAEVLKVNLQP